MDLSSLTSQADLEWQRDARCAEYADDELVAASFFPSDGKHTESKRAKEICAGCLVVDECLAYALDNFIRDGIWGGTSLRQREAMWRARRTAAGEIVA